MNVFFLSGDIQTLENDITNIIVIIIIIITYIYYALLSSVMFSNTRMNLKREAVSISNLPTVINRVPFSSKGVNHMSYLAHVVTVVWCVLLFV